MIKNIFYNSYRAGTSNQKLKTFLPAILISFIFQLLIASLQSLGYFHSFNPFFKVTGTFFNSGQTSLFLVAFLPFLFCILSYVFRRQKGLRLVFITLMIIILLWEIYIIGYVAGSRTAMIALALIVILTLISGYSYGWKYPIKQKMRRTFILIGSLLLLGLFIYSLSIKKRSVSGRLLIWKVSGQMISRHLLTGVGLGNFAIAYEKYQSDFFRKHPEEMNGIGMLADNTQLACNDFIQILCEQGIIGFLLFSAFLVSLLASPCIKYWKNSFSNDIKSRIELFSFIGILSFMIFSLLSYSLEIFSLAIIFIFYSALLSSTSVYKIKGFNLKKEGCYYLKNLMLISMFIAGIFLLRFTYNKYNAFKKWHETVVYYSVMSFDQEGKLKYAQAMKYLYPQLHHYGLFLMLYGGSLVGAGLNEEAVKELERAKEVSSYYQIYILLAKAYANLHEYKMAEKNYSFVYYMIPKKLIPRFLLCNLYHKEKDTAKFIAMANEIINFHPKISSPEETEIKKTVQEMLNSSHYK